MLACNHDSALGSTYLFGADQSDLSSLVSYGYNWEDKFSGVVSTGIPPHVTLLSQMIKLMQDHKRSVDELTNRIVKELDERQLGGILSESRISELLREANKDIVVRLDRMESGITAISGGATVDNSDSVGRTSTSSQQAFQLHLIKGKFRKVTSNWNFPKGTLSVAWMHWNCSMNGVPALRHLGCNDVDHLKHGPRTLRDLKKLMTRMDQEAQRLGMFREKPIVEVANAWYARAKHVVLVSREKGYSRYDQLTWRRALKMLEESERKKKQQVAGEGAAD